jgi:hypothetical protein
MDFIEAGYYASDTSDKRHLAEEVLQHEPDE